MIDYDNSRGHEDGDQAVGSDKDRERGLDLMFNSFLLSIAEEGVYGPDDLADACYRAAHILRHGRLRG